MQKFVNRFILCCIVPFLLDRITKYFVVANIWKDQDITSFFELYLTYNRGVSWGIGSSSNVYCFIALSAFVSVVFIAFLWYAYQRKRKLYAECASLLVIAGAFSNLLDRAWFGGVVDFIKFHWGTRSFPVFNLADVFIFCGILILLYADILEDNA